jgi:ABC-type glycerol-3-phosphate transport system substrate-binding protein
MWRKTIVTGLAVVALAACGGGAPSRTPAQQHYIEDVITGWQNTYGTSLPITEALVIKGGNADCAGLAS